MGADAPRPLIIPGGQRCGSTWLASYLDSHPRVSLARPRRPEPKVFLDPNADAGTWWRRCSPAEPDGNDRTGLPAPQWVLEKSTSYLERPETIARIERHLSDVRVVVVLRDPVERAISNWRFSTFNGLEDRPAEVALDPEHTPNGDAVTNDDGNSPGNVQPRRYLQRGRYSELLLPWSDRFGDRLHVVVLEELLHRETARTTLLRELGVAPTAAHPPGSVNASTDRVPVSQGVRDRLAEYYRPHRRPLEELLNRALPWGDPVPRD